MFSHLTRPAVDRRHFLSSTLATSAGLAITGLPQVLSAGPETSEHRDYRGPNVILIRFGGGVRRREVIDSQSRCYSPHLLYKLAPRGVLLKEMRIDTAASQTGHGQGTLNILTGKYDHYEDVTGEFFGERFEAKVPTLFEYLRQSFQVAEHETLIINGEDRTQEEFYTFSNHHLFGTRFRSNVLSLYRYKTFLLRQQILEKEAEWSVDQRKSKRRELEKMEALDYRRQNVTGQAPQITAFWEEWRQFYGDSGLVNPRGDRLLTELAVRALNKLQPKLMMINYNDCDYVHWGNMAHYTRGIAIMDAGIRKLVAAVEALDAYHENTVFVIVPDCGRDDSKFAAVPCQHHFNTRSSREIFALLFGPGVVKGQVVDRPTEQNQVAATIGKLMGFETKYAEGEILEEVLA